MTTPDILFSTDAGIGIVTFNRPQARNALTFPMYDELARLCTDITIDGPIRALIITGAGEQAFAAGTDISRFRDFKTPADAQAYERRIDEVVDGLERVPVPTIAAIRGACTGGGAAIAAACDLRIADAGLKFGFPIARTLGNCLSAASLSRLVSFMGAPRTREMIFTARLMGAEEALQLALISRIAQDPLAAAKELAVQVGAMAPITLRATKEGLRRLRVAGAEVDDTDLIEWCYGSADFREGMEAFFAKRKPQWQGR